MWAREVPESFGPRPHGVEHLAGHHASPPPPQQGLAQHRFRHPAVVAVGGVDEIDPGVQRRIDQTGGLGLVGTTAEGHAAQADFGHLQSAGGRDGGNAWLNSPV